MKILIINRHNNLLSICQIEARLLATLLGEKQLNNNVNIFLYMLLRKK